MPVTYQIDADAGMMFVVSVGESTQLERLETMQAWISDPTFRPGLHTLCDLSAATSTPTLEELRELVIFVKRNAAAIGKTKLAMVSAAPITFGVARQFQALSHSGPLRVQVFRDRGLALAWLREG